MMKRLKNTGMQGGIKNLKSNQKTPSLFYKLNLINSS